ncbi:MAG: tetratricopeptide repeat protein, partial [Saprospiraceae bacterium]
MKKILFTLFTFVLSVGIVLSQQDPHKALTKAGRALGSYNLDPANNGDKLKEAIDYIGIAAASAETNTKTKTWQTRGEIYNALADKDINRLIIDNSYVPERPDAPMIAAESFMKALELSSKKYEKKDALKGLKESGNKLSAIGNNQIQQTNYAEAYKALDFVMKINETLKTNGGTPVIEDADLDNHKFVVAYCANVAGEKGRAKELFKELYDAGTDEPTVYASYFNILFAEKDPEAIKVLEAGREKFPDNTEILFAEINYYIQGQQFDILEGKLKEAIAKEPNNPSVYSALGNVYMNLFQKEFEANDMSETAQKYFDSALDYFNQAVKIDEKQFDAIYSIGSLYFNRAVELVKKANDLPLNKAKEYDALMKESNELMNTSLPYFKKSESINPNDANTLIALKEIFARMSEFD